MHGGHQISTLDQSLPSSDSLSRARVDNEPCAASIQDCLSGSDVDSWIPQMCKGRFLRHEMQEVEGGSQASDFKQILENSMDRGAWWATVHGVAKSRARLSN